MENTLFIIGALIVIALVSVSTAKQKGRSSGMPKVPYRYQRKQYLMTRAEHDFFLKLQAIYSANYSIFPQVHLSTIFDHQVKGQNWKGALSTIDRKSVDYLICDKANLRPLVAIELDDWSHDRADRQTRDDLVESIFVQADMPLIRFESAGTDEATIRTSLDKYL